MPPCLKPHLLRGLTLCSPCHFCPPQFSASKSLPGGAAGAEALLGAVDVGAALVMSHMGLGALRDPALAPQLTEKLDAHLAAAASKGDSSAALAAALSAAGSLVGTRHSGKQLGCCGMSVAGAPDGGGLGHAGSGGVASAAEQQQEQQEQQQQEPP